MSQRRRPLRGRTALFLHAHPDDEAIFTAVTMRRLADRGGRVVLVTATGGDLGERHSLAPGESMRDRRIRELETAAGALGVARLVVLDRRDSGMSGWASGRHPRALARAAVKPLARRLARLADAEGAEVVVHDDDRGIYGHPDHVAVHAIGSALSRMTGLASYETTVDGPSVRDTGGHLLDPACPTGDYGRPLHGIDTWLDADDGEIAAKHVAMSAHRSQIPARALALGGFARRYGREWFVRRGPVGLLDELAARGRLAQPA